MASKTQAALEPDDDFEIVQINYRMPRVLYDAAEKLCKAAGGKTTVQALMTLTLAHAWQVPPPEIRPKGRPRKVAPENAATVTPSKKSKKRDK